MTELVFDCVGARAERYAAGPTLALTLRVSETTGERIGAVALRCQIRIQPSRRRYSPEEMEGLHDLFGEPARWGETLKPLQLATVTAMVPAFRNHVEVELPVPLTYDLEVATTRYFHGLAEGEVPMLLLFSGTVFRSNVDGVGMLVEQVPWHKECTYRLPIGAWRETMEAHFPGSGWLRLRRETIDALARFKAERALPTWEDTILALLKEAGG
jgi:hypothetical protein